MPGISTRATTKEASRIEAFKAVQGEQRKQGYNDAQQGGEQ